jgi:hypothetical protein
MRRWTSIVVTLAAGSVPITVLAGPAQAATVAALWHMESPTAMTDSSGHGNNGKTTAITSVTGSSGKGYHFNGKTSLVSVPDSASLDPGTANLTITAHIRFSVVPSVTTGDYDLIRKGLSGTVGGDWKMEIFPPTSGPRIGTAYCFFQDAKRLTASIRDTRNLADGKWHTVTCAKTATQIRLVVDGVIHAKSVRLGSISNSQPVALGAKPGGGDRYLGDMDEVSVRTG